MPLHSLTQKEKRVLEFVESYLKSEGISPTFQEIKQNFGFASLTSVQRYLQQLSRKNYIFIPGGNQKRAIQLLHPADSLKAHIHNLKDKSLTPFVGSTPKREVSTPQSSHTHRPVSESLSLPLCGKVAAGLPLEAKTYDEYIDVPPSLVSQAHNTYALKVVGQSMIDEGILDGDIIIVENSRHAKNGDLIVATIEDEATVKRIFYPNQSYGENLVELRPSNFHMSSMWYPPEKVEIQGKVVGLIRQFSNP